MACLSVLAEFGVVVSLANPHRSAGEFGYSAIRERRLIEINRRLGFMSSPEARDEVVPELDAEEMDALYAERDLLFEGIGRGRGLTARLMRAYEPLCIPAASMLRLAQ